MGLHNLNSPFNVFTPYTKKVSLVLGIRFEQDPQHQSRVGKVTFLENKYCIVKHWKT